jgi:hypothetical protein
VKRCDLINHPRACAIAMTKYRRKECDLCEAGEKNMAVMERPQPGDALADAPQTKSENRKPMEKEKAEMTTKEKILARVTREKVVGKSRFMQYDRIPSAELVSAAKELEAEGKIKIWPGRQAKSFIFTLPGLPDPLKSIRNTTPSKADGDPRPPALRKPKEKAIKTAAGDGVFAAAIAELEAKRQNIDNAIAALKALA